EFAEWLGDRKNSRKIPHRMEACGYEPMRNDGAKDGMWKIGGKRQVLQHLWPPHAPAGRTCGLQLHRPGPQGRGHHPLWRRLPDPLVLLCGRPGRGAHPPDEHALRLSPGSARTRSIGNSRHLGVPSMTSRRARERTAQLVRRPAEKSSSATIYYIFLRSAL